MIPLTLPVQISNVYATNRAEKRPLCPLQLPTTFSQSAWVCQASKQPEITAINSGSLAALTSYQKSAITPASLGSFSMVW